MQFTITPNAGKQFTVSTIVVQWQRSAAGNTRIALRSSLDSYAANIDGEKIVTDNTSTQTITWTVSQAAQTVPVTYRFYSYAEATTGTGGPGDGTGNDITVNGTVSDSGNPPTVTTGTSGSVTNNSALVSGNNVTADGGLTITERGVVFGTSVDPTTANGKATTTGTTGSYDTSITGLLGGTFYHARAFATNSAGTSYGSGITFTTEAALAPSVTTGTAGSVTGGGATISGNNVTSDGAAIITERGIVYATTSNPTIANSKLVVAGTTGAFDGNLVGLSPETPFYARAFATNSVGTTYGDEVTFTTLAISAPTVVTGTAGSIATTTATISTNNVTSDGGSPITERGVVYSTTVFPTTASTKLTSAGTTGTFNSSLTGLTAGTVYYLRAYATNAFGTSYGAQIGFATNFASVTKTFQEGTSSYVGTEDTHLSNEATGTNFGTATILDIDGEGPIAHGIIRFTNIVGSGASQIPSGSTVSAATLRFNVENSGTTLNVHRMLTAWTENTSTWNTLGSGIQANNTEAATTVLGTFASPSSGSTTTASGLQSAVQAWVNGDANHGFAILPTGTNGVGLYSSEWTTTAQRPLLSVTYTPASPAVILPPTVVTGTAGSLTPSGATITANNVTSAGGGTITERGVVFSSSQNPTTASSKVAVAGTTGAFDASLTGLSANTLYYARAFATNSAGTDYGSQISFTTTMAGGTIALGGSVTARSATYGSASTAASFTVSGTGLTGDLTVTPPAGFETSLNEGSGYGATTLITASGTLASTTVYVRLAAATTPGNYSGNITVSGGGASSETLAIPSSTVSAKELTLTGAAVTTKPYDTTTAATITGTLSGIVSPDVVTFTGTGTFAQADVGTGISVTAAIVLTGANAANYTIAQPTGLTGDITKASQTIAFGALPTKLVSDAPFDLNATATSGLSVSYSSSNELVATVSGSTVTIVGAGTTTLTASQAGNGNYDPATPVDQALTVTTGPTVLTPGDIAVIGFNSNAPDGFAFVTWVDLNPDTVIKFTDNGFLSADSAIAANNGRGGENFATWTNSTGNVIPAGTVISVVDDANPDTVSQGSIVQSLSGISNSGDQIFAYQGPGAGTSASNSDFGTNANPSTFTGTILFGLNFASDWLSTGTAGTTTSYRPSELAAANTSIALTTVSTTRGQYTGSRSGQTLAQFKAAVADPGNWTTATSTGVITLDTTAFTFPTAVAASGQFDFAPHDGAATSFAYNGTAISNVTVSDITYVGVTPGNNDPNLQGQWPNTGTLNASGAANADLVGTPNTGAYYQFTLTADAGYILSNPKLRFNVGREANGPRQFQWRSSVDGFVSPIAATLAMTAASTDGGVTTNPGTEIFGNEFRGADVNFFGSDAITPTNYNEVSLTTTNRSAITFRFYAYGTEFNNGGARLTRFLDFLLDVTQLSTAVPGAPVITGITANNNQLRIAFTPPSGTVTGYEYSLDGGTTWTATSPAIPTSPLVINGLTNGQVYAVQLRASNGNGTGDGSAVQNGTPQPNTITGLAATDTRTLNGSGYALGATASSGLTVSYASSNTGVATVSGSTVTIEGAGTTTITASQPGDGDFAAAPNVTQTLTVLPAGWNLIENFESRTLGSLDTQNNWSVVVGAVGGTGTTTVTADPADAGNKVATLSGTHTAASRFMASLSPTETVTLFKRFRLENIDTSTTNNSESHLNMGVSNLAAPSGAGDFSLHTSVTPTVSTPFRIRHTPESAPSNVTVASDIWYSSWYVVNNNTGKFKLYIQGGSQTSPVLAADGTVTDGLWTYRNAGAITAARVYLRTLANHNAPAYVDDIYFAAGENLADPVTTIATTGTLAALSTTYGTASTAASFTVSGTGLTGNLTVTPPAGFETSLTEGSGYGATTTITASGTLASTPVYVRLTAATAPGSYSGNIVVSGGGASSQNVAIPSSTVSTKELTLSSAAVTSKEYDTNTTATITGTLSGIVSPDVVTFSGTGTFASANVDTGISVTAAIVLTGANAAKYTILQPAGLTGDITAKNLTITGLTGNNKPYDGNTTATVSGSPALVGVISPDDVSISGTPVYTFASAAPGTGIAITTTGFTLGGAQAGNYTVTQPSLTANITQLTQTITGLAAAETRLAGAVAYNLAATSSSGLTVAYSSSDGNVATISGSTVTVVGAGTTTITATQTGDTNYAAAPPITQTLTILPTTWTLIENFTGLNTGNLSGQSGWANAANSSGTVGADPGDAGNLVGILQAGEQIQNYKNLAIAGPNQTATMFLRFRIGEIDNDAANNTETAAYMGVSDAAAPSIFGNFRAQWGTNPVFSLNNPTPTTPFHLTSTDNPDLAGTVINRFVNQQPADSLWYHAWVVLDKSTAKYSLYLQGGEFTSQTLVTELDPNSTSAFDFRGGGNLSDTETLKVYLRSGAAASHEAPLYFDDIYLAAGQNLTPPVTPVHVPIIATGTSGSITRTTAEISANDVTSDGNSTITERGVVFSTSPNPTTADTKVVVSGTTGTFNASLTGLVSGSPYYVRAFATNAIGTAYGSGINFNANGVPVFSGMALNTTTDSPVLVIENKILARITDADGGPATITGVAANSAEGGTLSRNGGIITYTPALAFSGTDSFTVSVDDGFGAINITIQVTVATDPLFTSPANAPRLTALPGGAKRIAFNGIPGRTYAIQRSTTMAPGSWTQIAAVQAAADSSVSYDDPTPPQPSAFYRIAYPAQ
jgi:hypothetical protein